LSKRKLAGVQLYDVTVEMPDGWPNVSLLVVADTIEGAINRANDILQEPPKHLLKEHEREQLAAGNVIKAEQAGVIDG
jgi:uncharacterized protein YhdP